MNVIIYARDFEPITSIDLPVDLLKRAEQDGRIGLAIKTPPNSDGTLTLPKIIPVECFKIKWIDGSYKPVLVTEHEEDALRLKPEWLVGQRAVIKVYDRTLKILSNKIKKMSGND